TAVDDVHADGADGEDVGLARLVRMQLEIRHRLVLRLHRDAGSDVDHRLAVAEVDGPDARGRGQGEHDVAALRAPDRARALAQPVQADDGQPAVGRAQALLALGAPAVD